MSFIQNLRAVVRLERIETDSDRDRWFTADEACEYGFIDKVIDRSTATTAAAGNA